MLSLRQIYKNYGETSVLKGVDLDIQTSELCTIQGASGSGKSTLLYLMGGLDRASSGQVLFDGQDLAKFNDEKLSHFRNQNIGFVFQFHFLLSSMTCLDNILLPAKIGQSLHPGLKKQVKQLAEQIGIGHCLKKYPYQLSGGEQQRVNIIRALSLKPQILLCDEPTGNLDSKATDQVMDLLFMLSQQSQTSLVVVTHDDRVASRFERKITIEDGQIIS